VAVPNRWLILVFAALAVTVALAQFGSASGEGVVGGVAKTPQALLHSPVRAPAEGVATLRHHYRGHRQSAFMDVRLRGLGSPGRGYVYAIWLSSRASRGYPLAPLVPFPQDGHYADRFSIPSTAKPALRKSRFVQIKLATAKKIRKAVLTAIRSDHLLMAPIGRTVLQGRLSDG
jgi:hypothetical protein